MNYTINNIDTATGNIKVTFDVDGKEQTLADAPLDDKEALQAWLSEYARAYQTGLESQEQTVPADVDALVGKKQAVSEG